jgi:hypothetical protein
MGGVRSDNTTRRSDSVHYEEEGANVCGHIGVRSDTARRWYSVNYEEEEANVCGCTMMRRR